MTEANENGFNGTVLVRLRAVAMERDDNSEGWVPIGAGGLSNVCVVKRAVTSPVLSSIPDAPAATATSSLPGAPCPDSRTATNTNSLNSRYEFVIYAHRLIDNELVFRCTICKDFEYNKVMPTFHNWKTGGKRVGLIFQTAADGRVFDRGIMGVLVELSAGLELLPSSLASLESDNEVFMAVELPYKFDNKRKSEINSRHVSPTSTDSSSQKGTPPVSETELKTYRFKQQQPQQSLSPKEQPCTYQPSVPPPNLSVFPHQLPRPVEVGRNRAAFYPPPSPPAPPLPQTATTAMMAQIPESPETFKRRVVEQQNTTELHYHHPNHPHHQHHVSSSFANSEKPPSVVCRHCRKTYTSEENVKGSCEQAPDCVRSGIHAVTCIPCARTIVYHCLSSRRRNNFVAHPDCNDCDCGSGHYRCSGRWIGLTILSILLPCLWCYPLLKACHLCGVSCGACGGRHEPMNAPPPPHSSSTTTS